MALKPAFKWGIGVAVSMLALYGANVVTFYLNEGVDLARLIRLQDLSDFLGMNLADSPFIAGLELIGYAFMALVLVITVFEILAFMPRIRNLYSPEIKKEILDQKAQQNIIRKYNNLKQPIKNLQNYIKNVAKEITSLKNKIKDNIEIINFLNKKNISNAIQVSKKESIQEIFALNEHNNIKEKIQAREKDMKQDIMPMERHIGIAFLEKNILKQKEEIKQLQSTVKTLETDLKTQQVTLEKFMKSLEGNGMQSGDLYNNINNSNEALNPLHGELTKLLQEIKNSLDMKPGQDNTSMQPTEIGNEYNTLDYDNQDEYEHSNMLSQTDYEPEDSTSFDRLHYTNNEAEYESEYEETDDEEDSITHSNN